MVEIVYCVTGIWCSANVASGLKNKEVYYAVFVDGDSVHTEKRLKDAKAWALKHYGKIDVCNKQVQDLTSHF